jgi:hypothetical protein
MIIRRTNSAVADRIGQQSGYSEDAMITRRMLLEGTGTTLMASSLGLPSLFAKAAGLELSSNLPDGTRAEAVLESLPGKKPLIKLSYRPPNYETPIEYFRTGITASDAFFVRYHCGG